MPFIQSSPQPPLTAPTQMRNPSPKRNFMREKASGPSAKKSWGGSLMALPVPLNCLPPSSTSSGQQSRSYSVSNMPLFATLNRWSANFNMRALPSPNGKGLLAPLYKLLPQDHTPSNKRKHLQIPKGSEAYNALHDLRTMLKLVANRPTKCAQLVPGWPHFIGFCDACKWGAGGVWLSGKEDIHPTVWRVKWPPDIAQRMISPTNPTGDLTINDLEMAGLLLHYLVLEQLVDTLEHKHAAAWCDNTSTVSWARRLSSSKSLVGQRLVRALSIRHVVTKSSPLAPWSIAGANNNMADLASRSFRKGGKGNFALTDTELLTKFNSTFPLSQDASWHMHTLSTRVSSLVLCRAASTATTHGVVAQTNKNRTKFWRDWRTFVAYFGLPDPLLQGLPRARTACPCPSLCPLGTNWKHRKKRSSWR